MLRRGNRGGGSASHGRLPPLPVGVDGGDSVPSLCSVSSSASGKNPMLLHRNRAHSKWPESIV